MFLLISPIFQLIILRYLTMTLYLHLASIVQLIIYFLAPATRGANCYGDNGPHPQETYAWEVRQAVCGNGACNDQFAALGSRTNCTMLMPLTDIEVAGLFVADTT